MKEPQKNYTIHTVCTNGRVEGKSGDEDFILDKYNPDGDDFPKACKSEPRTPVDEDFYPMATQQLLVFPRHLIAQMLGEAMQQENMYPENMRGVTSEVVKNISEVTCAIANIRLMQGVVDNAGEIKAEECREIIEAGRSTLTRLLPKLPVQLDVSTVVEDWNNFFGK